MLQFGYPKSECHYTLHSWDSSDKNAFYWSQNKETLTTTTCCITGVSAYVFCFVSIYTLVFVSIERFTATNHPLKHRQVFIVKLVEIGVSVIWIWSAAFCSLPFASSRYKCVEKYFHCTVDWTCSIILFVFGNFLHFLTIMYCYVYILRAARIGQRSQARHSHVQNGKNSRNTLTFLRDHKAPLLIVVIVAAFIICWTPYVIGGLFVSNYNLPRRFMSTAILLTVGNTAANLVIYGVMNQNFRETFKTTLYPRKSHARPI